MYIFRGQLNLLSSVTIRTSCIRISMDSVQFS